MVKGYEFYNSDCNKCGMEEHESHDMIGADYVLATDYDALEAENAELRDLVGKKNESIEVLYAKWSKEIAKAEAANATLDALREVIAPDKVISNSTCMKAVDILYPTPERRSMREIADANGFAPMPPELGQRNIDGETNFVAIQTPETDND